MSSGTYYFGGKVFADREVGEAVVDAGVLPTSGCVMSEAKASSFSEEIALPVSESSVVDAEVQIHEVLLLQAAVAAAAAAQTGLHPAGVQTADVRLLGPRRPTTRALVRQLAF